MISQKIEAQSNYKNYKGKVIEVTKGTEGSTVTVKSEDKDSNFETIKFNLSKEAFVLTDNTLGEIEIEKIVEGMTVEVFYDKDAPMTKSLPPITNAKVLVVRESEEQKYLGVKVDRFNEELISIDNFLKLNITEDTVIVDKDGKKLSKEDLYNKDLIVFYGPAMTMSIPAQSNAVKIIVVGEQEKPEEKPEVPELNPEIEVLDKIIYHKSEDLSSEIKLKNKMYKSGETMMMPIREISESLGYKVSWNGKTKQAEIVKGANFLTASSNQDMYSFAKMIVKLGKVSENKNGTMFVPVSFIEEVMQLEMNVDKDGTMNIK